MRKEIIYTRGYTHLNYAYIASLYPGYALLEKLRNFPLQLVLLYDQIRQ